MNISLSCPTAFCITDKCRPDFKDFNFGRLHNPYASLTKQFILRRQLNKPNAMCSWHHFQFYLTLHFIIRFVHSPNLPYSPFYHFIHSSISFVPSFVFVCSINFPFSYPLIVCLIFLLLLSFSLPVSVVGSLPCKPGIYLFLYIYLF